MAIAGDGGLDGSGAEESVTVSIWTFDDGQLAHRHQLGKPKVRALT